MTRCKSGSSVTSVSIRPPARANNSAQTSSTSSPPLNTGANVGKGPGRDSARRPNFVAPGPEPGPPPDPRDGLRGARQCPDPVADRQVLDRHLAALGQDHRAAAEADGFNG